MEDTVQPLAECWLPTEVELRPNTFELIHHFSYPQMFTDITKTFFWTHCWYPQ